MEGEPGWEQQCHIEPKDASVIGARLVSGAVQCVAATEGELG